MNPRDLDKVRPLFRDALRQVGPVELHLHLPQHRFKIELRRDGITHLLRVYGRDDRLVFSSGPFGLLLDEELLCLVVIHAAKTVSGPPTQPN